MKTLLLLTLTLTLNAQQTPAPAKVDPTSSTQRMATLPDASALTPEHVTIWKQNGTAINNAQAALNQAKVALLDAQEARQRAEMTLRAVLDQADAMAVKMLREAKCTDCTVAATPDGKLIWKKPSSE